MFPSKILTHTFKLVPMNSFFKQALLGFILALIATFVTIVVFQTLLPILK